MTNNELERCIDAYGTAIYSFCRHLTCNQVEADDLYQDTFLTFIERREKIEYEQNPKSYLLSIALHLWKNKKRKYAWRKRIADTDTSFNAETHIQTDIHEISPEELLLEKEDSIQVHAAVAKLPPKLKIVTLLYYMEDQSTAQIASILKIPAGTVKSRLHQARKLLEKELEDVLNGK